MVLKVKRIIKHFLPVSFIFIISGCALLVEKTAPLFDKTERRTQKKRDLRSFSLKNQQCYDRQKEPHTFVVDSHVHFRPFGGAAIPFGELIGYFKKTGVFFVNVYGIGQSLPVHSSCAYYLNCPGEPAMPSIKNDFVNAANYIEFKPKGCASGHCQ